MVDKPQYRKLSRRAGSLISHSQLWKGSDHLLLVKEVGCAEEYKRFHYRDIQALVVIRSKAYAFWAVFLPVLALLLGGVVYTVGDVGSVGGWIAALVVWFVVHLVRGPTCKCWIQTGINLERLIMFKRTAQVRKFMARVQPDIVSAQGRFSIDEMEGEPAPETR